MMPSIHDGHMVTAKLPFLKPASQSFDQVGTLALTPSDDHLHRGVPGLLDDRVRVGDQLVVAVVEVGVTGLRQHRAEAGGDRVDEALGAGVGGGELLAGGDELVPARPQLRDRRRGRSAASPWRTGPCGSRRPDRRRRCRARSAARRR